MSKTHKDAKKLDSQVAQMQARKVAVRFKTERKRKDERKLYNFTTWIERTAQED